jgi:hypothetical protein
VTHPQPGFGVCADGNTNLNRHNVTLRKSKLPARRQRC